VASHQLMTELLENQQAGIMEVDPDKLLLNAGVIDRQYPEDFFPGHSAWLKWPYKLHRIQSQQGSATIEMYNLQADPMEETDIAGVDTARASSMKKELENWQVSVMKSLNGKDY
jgi:hypothetical protein